MGGIARRFDRDIAKIQTLGQFARLRHLLQRGQHDAAQIGE